MKTSLQNTSRVFLAFHPLRFLLIAIALFAGFRSSYAQNYPTAAFNLSEIHVDQSAGLVQVPITMSGSHSGTSYVVVSTREITAYENTDFHVDYFKDRQYWHSTDAPTRYLNIPIYRTGAHEDRSFQLVLESPYQANIGTPFSCTVIINAAPYAAPRIRITSARVNSRHYLTVRGTTTADAAIVSNRVTVNGRSISTSGYTRWSAQTRVRIPGTYSVVATTTDSVGNVAKTYHTYRFR